MFNLHTITWPLPWAKHEGHYHYVDLDAEAFPDYSSIIDRHWCDGEPTDDASRNDAPRFLVTVRSFEEDIGLSDELELKCWLISHGLIASIT